MDTVRAWKDPEYRRTLDSGILPQHPAGMVALDDDSLDEVAGGTTGACFAASIVISYTITQLSVNGMGSCAYGTSGCC